MCHLNVPLSDAARQTQYVLLSVGHFLAALITYYHVNFRMLCQKRAPRVNREHRTP